MPFQYLKGLALENGTLDAPEGGEVRGRRIRRGGQPPQAHARRRHEKVLVASKVHGQVGPGSGGGESDEAEGGGDSHDNSCSISQINMDWKQNCHEHTHSFILKLSSRSFGLPG